MKELPAFPLTGSFYSLLFVRKTLDMVWTARVMGVVIFFSLKNPEIAGPMRITWVLRSTVRPGKVSLHFHPMGKRCISLEVRLQAMV